MKSEIRTVAIIGLGALGIMYADRLGDKMDFNNLRIVADKDRIQRYQKEGIYCNGKKCHFNYVDNKADCEPADLVIFSVKFNGLQEAIDSMKKQIGDNTIIISALNGISSEEIIGESCGHEKMLYSAAHSMDAQKVGNYMKYDNIGRLTIGNRESGIISEKVKKTADFFETVDFPYEISKDMYRTMYGKFMLNVGVNQTVALFEGTYGTVQQAGEARDIMISAMKEVMDLSSFENVNLDDHDLRYWLDDVLTKVSPDGKPSMRQDMEARRLSEVDIFAGTVLKKAEKFGLKTPVNQMLYTKIKEREDMY